MFLRARASGRIWLRAALLLTVLVAIVSPVLPRSHQRSADAAFVMSPTDPLISMPRGTPEKVLRFAQASGSSPMAEVRAYIYEMYRLAPLVGMDPSILIAQSAHETGNWTSSYWRNSLNPAGIGIFTGDEDGYKWPDGAASARYQIVLLYIYAVGVIDPGNPLYPYKDDGPGYDVTIRVGYGGCCRIIDDLTGRWAVDSFYGTNLARRGTEIFAPGRNDAPDPAVDVPIVDASSGTNPNRARDGNLDTTWAVTGIGAPPRGAYAIFDLGRTRQISEIQWVFRRTGFADSFDVQVALQKGEWTTVGSFGNAPARVWQKLSVSRNARLVRFLFKNPNNDLMIGFLAEVEFFGPRGTATATATPFPTPTPTKTPIPTATPSPTSTPGPSPTATPVLTGPPLALTGGGGSANGSPSRTVRDGDPSTVWRTVESGTPAQGHVFVDLGGVSQLRAIQWRFGQSGGNAAYRVMVSNDKKTWTTLARRSGGQPGEWQTQWTGASARYVRLFFDNPTGAPILGFVQEIRVFGTPVGSAEEASPTPTMTPTVTLTGDVLPIVTSGGSAGSTGTRKAWDGDPATNWSTSGAPARAHIHVDLGGPGRVTGIEWQFGQDGGAADYEVLVSTDKITWVSVGVFNGAKSGIWQRLPVEVDARYVRFMFHNGAGAPVLGYLAEIRVYGEPRTASAELPTETSTPTPSPTATATPSVEPSPAIEATPGDSTPEPTATFEPSVTPESTAAVTVEPTMEPTSTPVTDPTIEPTSEPPISTQELPAA